jgi:flagellar hook-associated protein 3 FlgL
MRIPNVTISTGVIQRLNRLKLRQNLLNDEIATGQKISSASDDPQAAVRVMRLRSEKMALQQYSQNVDKLTGLAQASFASLNRLKTISDRSGELAASASGIASEAERKAYATELNEMIKSAIEQVNTKFNGDYIFSGQKTDASSFTAAGTSAKPTSVTFDTTGGDTTKVRVSDTLEISAGTSQVENGQLGTFINNLIALRDAMESNSSSGIATARTALMTSEDDIVNAISQNGAVQTRLEALKQQNDSRFGDVEQLVSREVDADLAQSMVKLSQTQTAYQAAVQSGAQIMKLSLLDYV